MRWHRSGTAGFRRALGRAEVRGSPGAEKVSPVVGEILRAVREGGDAALAEYTRRFDRFDPRRKGFAVPPREIDAAWRRLPAALRRSLELAGGRVGGVSRVAGVPEIVAACSAPGGKVPDVVLAAARIAGVSAVYRIGGAQAIAALAYGTESVPRVDVISGPGNAYVNGAKPRDFGSAGIATL